MRHAIVVGAGIIGSSVAFHLARAGIRVTLLDAGRPGGGTSMATLAWVNALTRRPEHYFRLSQRAMAEHRALERELGGDWIRGNGCLEWGADEGEQAELAERVELLQAWGYAAQRLDPAEARRRVEPTLRTDGVEAPWLAWFSDDQYVQVNPIIAALLADARRNGTEARTGTRVAELERDGDRVRGVVLADGTHLAADIVVDCAGHRADGLLASHGFTLPLHPEPGLILLTEPAPTTLNGVLRAPGLEVREDGGGRLLLSALFAEDQLDAQRRPTLDDPACDQAIGRARTLVAGLDHVGLEAVRLGVRPMPDDGRPLVGPVPGIEGAYVVATHSGVSLGPLLGRLVADELTSGEPTGTLEHYRPDRAIGSADA